MDFFNYKNGELYCEDVPAAKIARDFGTPAYVYSKATLLHHYNQLATAFAPLKATICYSIKSLGNINICKVLASQGCGFDVTSGGELFRAMLSGGDPAKMIYAGVGKTDREIIDAINAGIAAFNLESEAEIENIDRVAASINRQAIGAIRVNPDVDPKTHVKTTTGKKETKFGVDIERAERVFEQYRNLKNLRIAGVHIHIGSPVYEIQPYVDAVKKITALIDRLTERGHKIEWFDLGGGFAVNYERPDQAFPVSEHAKALIPLLQGKPYRIALEPGRYIAGNAGILLTQVLYRKTGGEKKFVIVDAGMNDLIRPTLYESYHHIWPVKPDAVNIPQTRSKDFQPTPAEVVDVVGPICESGDYLAKARTLPPTKRGDLLAVFTAGAYGFAMSSNYNNRPRAPEILVDGGQAKLIRRRETYEDLVALSGFEESPMENLPPPIPYYQHQVQTISVDESHLRMLAIFHYVLGGLMMFVSCFSLIYLMMGIVFLRGGFIAPSSPGFAAPTTQQAMIDQQMQQFMGWMFVGIASGFFVFGETIGFLLIYSGRCIAKQRRRMFSLVMAGISCIHIPLGTTLGIFTFVVLLRQSVMELYATTPRR